DVIITTDWNPHDIDNIIRVLHVFHLASGHKINIHKSNIFGIGVSNDEISSMASRTGYAAGGRLTLIKAVLGSLGIYYLSIFKASETILNSMKSIHSRFFWGGSQNSRNMAWVKWSQVLFSFKKGGLQIGSLKVQPCSPSKVALKGCSFNGTWSKIIGTSNFLHSKGIIPLNSFCFKVGCGTRVRFWKDVWIGDSPLHTRYNKVYRLDQDKDCLIIDRIVNALTTEAKERSKIRPPEILTLKALAGSASWFCPGSLIIFTGKDKQLLRSHRVDVEDMDFLDEDESLELFSLHAFEDKCPSIGFQELAEKAVKYVQGHPLALIILGCFLYSKTVSEWVSELERLREHPNEEIHRVLRLSYDGLNLEQQDILLDIACLFIGENSDFVASILDGCNFFADTNMRVLVDKSLITISSNMSLQMHDLIQAMARAVIREESIMLGKQRRLLISSKVALTEAVEVLVLPLEKFSQKVHIDANDFAHMKKLRILKIYQEEERFGQKLEFKGHNVIFSGNLYYLSNELGLFYWHGCPFKYLPSDFYPENIVAIDLSYSNIKDFWTTPKCFRRLKVIKLRCCCNLTTTPNCSEITNLEELSLEGCVNLISVHPSIGMLKRLVVLNLRDCKQLQNFPSRVEMGALQVLNLTGCLKVNQLPEALGQIKSLTELHIDRTAITELPSFVSSLIKLESLSFGGQGRIQPRWWTAPFGLLSKQQHPQRALSLAGLHTLKSLNLRYCNLEQVPESIGGLSCLEKLYLTGNNLLEVPKSIGGLSCLKELKLGWNNFTSLPGSLSQLSHLQNLDVNGCKKLEVLPELPPSVWRIGAFYCTSIQEMLGSSKDTNGCEFFRLPASTSGFLDYLYYGNSVAEWFTNRSRENQVKVELASDWCYDKKFRGYATCVVFKCKRPFSKLKGYSVKNFDGSSLIPNNSFCIIMNIGGIHESDMIWLHYTNLIEEWKEAKNFVTFSFEENNEDYEVKEFGVRLICDEDVQQGTVWCETNSFHMDSQLGHSFLDLSI
nr:NB-ARC domains-containing protein [Tanacetum cinerariifolium]